MKILAQDFSWKNILYPAIETHILVICRCRGNAVETKKSAVKEIIKLKRTYGLRMSLSRRKQSYVVKLKVVSKAFSS